MGISDRLGWHRWVIERSVTWLTATAPAHQPLKLVGEDGVCVVPLGHRDADPRLLATRPSRTLVIAHEP